MQIKNKALIALLSSSIIAHNTYCLTSCERMHVTQNVILGTLIGSGIGLLIDTEKNVKELITNCLILGSAGALFGYTNTYNESKLPSVAFFNIENAIEKNKDLLSLDSEENIYNHISSSAKFKFKEFPVTEFFKEIEKLKKAFSASYDNLELAIKRHTYDQDKYNELISFKKETLDKVQFILDSIKNHPEYKEQSKNLKIKEEVEKSKSKGGDLSLIRPETSKENASNSKNTASAKDSKACNIICKVQNKLKEFCEAIKNANLANPENENRVFKQ